MTSPYRSWNGLAGELAYNRADIALQSMIVQSQRIKVMDFSAPILDSGFAAGDEEINGPQKIIAESRYV